MVTTTATPLLVREIVIVEETDFELKFDEQEIIPCQCLHGGDYTESGHALHFIYKVSRWRRIKPQKKYVAFEPGHPRDDVFPECTRAAEFRATFKGKYPGLGKLITSSYTLCGECLEWWITTENCSYCEAL